MSNPFYGGANSGFNGMRRMMQATGGYSSPTPSTYSTGMYPGWTGTGGFQQQPIMQPTPQPQTANFQQNLQSMIPQSNIIWIDDMNQIASFPTGRGWQQWFGLKNEQVFFVRETDMNGVIQPLQRVRYEMEMITDSNAQTTQVPQVGLATQPAQQTPDKNQNGEMMQQPIRPVVTQPMTNGVSRDEFEKLSSSVNMMLDKLGDLLK